MTMMQVSLRYCRDVVPVHGPVPEAHHICQDRNGAYRLWGNISVFALQYMRSLRHSR